MIRQIQQIATLQASYEKYRQIVLLKEMELQAPKQSKHFHLSQTEIAEAKRKWPNAYVVKHLDGDRSDVKETLESNPAKIQ